MRKFWEGLSLGEYVALTAAGVFDFETGLRLIKARIGQTNFIFILYRRSTQKDRNRARYGDPTTFQSYVNVSSVPFLVLGDPLGCTSSEKQRGRGGLGRNEICNCAWGYGTGCLTANRCLRKALHISSQIIHISCLKKRHFSRTLSFEGAFVDALDVLEAPVALRPDALDRRILSAIDLEPQPSNPKV